MLTQASTLTETSGYNAGNTGLDEYSERLAEKTLSGTAYSIEWGGAPGPPEITYKDGKFATIEVDYDPADVTGLRDAVPVANVAARVRLMQIGAPITKNHGSPATLPGYVSYQIRNISQPPEMGIMIGKTENIAGSFDVGVFGKAIEPIHQDPNIARLHTGDYSLSGAGGGDEPARVGSSVLRVRLFR
jgi:hypothetical protein